MQIVVDGILTQYTTLGKGKKTILILHGWQQSSREWNTIIHSLAKNATVIALDLPGFGQTPRPQTTYTIYEYATFVEHFLQKLAYKKVILIGHSFGGRIGILLGARTKLLSQLFLVDSAAIETKSIWIKTKIMINKILISPIKLISPHKIEPLKSRFGSDDYQHAGAMRDIFIQTVNEDLSPYLKQVAVPTVIIWGEKDIVRPLSEAKYIKKSIPGARLRIVWGAGHSPFIEKPKEFLEIIKEYIC